MRSLLFHSLERSLRCLSFGRKKRRDRLRTHRTDVENHVIQEKINQMTKHAPRMHVVEKTVEEHFAGLAQLASRISTILKFGDETGGDPFAKVKSLITVLIDRLQDASDKNQLAENDELGFWTGLRQ